MRASPAASLSFAVCLALAAGLLAGPLTARGGAPRAATAPPAGRTLSIVGTTDLHGRIFADDDRGGLALLGGYLANLRAARAADGGAVVLLDAGDTYQGGIESNLSEGAVVIDAYNALGYSAAAIGNHDFEFGPIDDWRPGASPTADRRGALKARAAQARFPFLAANLLEDGRPVAWPNVVPSALIDAAGIPVGLIGVMTYDALSMTLAANVTGLRTTPLAEAVAREATRLRADGARVVIVTAHAGGDCSTFDRPTDVSACDDTAEIFDVARHLPQGLVDVIMAGHTHAAVAHEVNGVAIAQAYSWGRAFSRVDLTVPTDAAGARVSGVRIFAPQAVCAREDAKGACAGAASAGTPSTYEGRPVTADLRVQVAMAPALQQVSSLRATPLGVALDAPLVRGMGDDESPLGNLFADAFRAATPGADVGLSYASGPGGLRADLASGPVSLGAVYDVFPFDNLVVRRTMTGAALRQVLAAQMRRARFGGGRALGVSGLRVEIDCDGSAFQAALSRPDGSPLRDDETLSVVMSDFLAARAASLTGGAIRPRDGETTLQMRDAVTAWLRQHPGRLAAGAFGNRQTPRWTRVLPASGACPAG